MKAASTSDSICGDSIRVAADLCFHRKSVYLATLKPTFLSLNILPSYLTHPTIVSRATLIDGKSSLLFLCDDATDRFPFATGHVDVLFVVT